VDAETRHELEATVEARRELGAAHEQELIDGFLERLDRRLGERTADTERSAKRRRDHQKEMTLGAMAISIPLIAIAGGIAGLAGIVAVCAALAIIAIMSSRQ
jgi:phosphoribosylcarboxyaminoimidazole (NCAIR) mutase